jgi:tetratricopeptide (TPR) repeat protein
MSKNKVLPPEAREKLLDKMHNIAHDSTLPFKEKEQQLISLSRQHLTIYQVQFYLGKLYENDKNFTKAIDHYNQAEELLTADDFLTAQIARHLAPNNDALNKEINLLKTNRAAIYTSKGVCYTGLGDKEQAFRSCNQALADNPNYAMALSNRAGAHIELGNYKAALIDARDAIRLELYDVYAWGSLSEAHLKLKNYSQAAYVLSKVKKLEEDIAAAQKGSDKQESNMQISSYSSSLSRALSQLDQIDIPSFKNSVVIKNNHRERCGKIANRTDINFTKKAQLLNDLSPAHSKSYSQHFFLGALAARENELQQAFYHYNQAEKLLIDELLIVQTASNAEPQDVYLAKNVELLKVSLAQIYNHIGNYHEKLGDKEQAFHSYNQALSYYPGNTASSNRAKIYIDRGNYKAALSDAYEAIYHRPHHPDAWLYCSEAHAKLDEFSKARHALSKFKELVLVSTDKELLEEAAKLEKFIAAAQERSKGQERSALPLSSSSSSSSSSQQQSAPKSVAPKSSPLARSDDPIMTFYKEGEASKENLDALLTAIQVKQEPQEQEQPTLSSSTTTKPQAEGFAARVSNKRNRSEQSSANATEQAQDTLQEPGKQSKSEQVASSRQTRSNGKGGK